MDSHPPRYRDIVTAAAQQVYRQGFAATSLASIAADLKLTKGALSHHFPTKDCLLTAINDHLVKAITSIRDHVHAAELPQGISALWAFQFAIGRRLQEDAVFRSGVTLVFDPSVPTAALQTPLQVWESTIRAFVAAAQTDGSITTTHSVDEVTAQLLANMFGGLTFTRRYGRHSTRRGQLDEPMLHWLGVANPEEFTNALLANWPASLGLLADPLGTKSKSV